MTNTEAPATTACPLCGESDAHGHERGEWEEFETECEHDHVEVYRVHETAAYEADEMTGRCLTCGADVESYGAEWVER